MTWPIAVDGQKYESGPVGATSNAVPLTTGGTNTKGSYVEAIAATQWPAIGVLVQITIGAGNRPYLIDVAVGAAASEQVIIPNLLYTTGPTSPLASYFIPVSVPKGSRVAVRAASATGSSTCSVQVQLVSGGFNSAITGSAVETMGVLTASSNGTQIDPGGSANTKGSWVELIAATTRISRWLAIGTDNRNNTARANAQWQVDIGIGAGGSEVVLIPNLMLFSDTSGDLVQPSTFPTMPITIPAGTRVAARAQCSITDATDRLFGLGLYGIG